MTLTLCLYPTQEVAISTSLTGDLFHQNCHKEAWFFKTNCFISLPTCSNKRSCMHCVNFSSCFVQNLSKAASVSPTREIILEVNAKSILCSHHCTFRLWQHIPTKAKKKSRLKRKDTPKLRSCGYSLGRLAHFA